MWGWLPGRGCLGCLWAWAGWGAAPAEAVAGCPARLCGVAGCRVLFGIGNTPVAAWFGWWWVPLACFVCVGVARCRGSGAVRPGCLVCVLLPFLRWWGVGVGGLVVNCIVDASILL